MVVLLEDLLQQLASIRDVDAAVRVVAVGGTHCRICSWHFGVLLQAEQHQVVGGRSMEAHWEARVEGQGHARWCA